MKNQAKNSALYCDVVRCVQRISSINKFPINYQKEKKNEKVTPHQEKNEIRTDKARIKS
jgi:hypothetical protein